MRKRTIRWQWNLQQIVLLYFYNQLGYQLESTSFSGMRKMTMTWPWPPSHSMGRQARWALTPCLLWQLQIQIYYENIQTQYEIKHKQNTYPNTNTIENTNANTNTNTNTRWALSTKWPTTKTRAFSWSCRVSRIKRAQKQIKVIGEIKINQNQYYNQYILDKLYLRNYKSQTYITWACMMNM